jgi:RimJ/RimL family protein N-acetyltransferase
MADGNKHDLLVDGVRIRTARLILRPWVLDDAEAALAIYGAGEVSRWLAPAVERVPNIASMREHLGSWMVECASLDSCQGRWAIVQQGTGEVVGGVTLLPLPPYELDLQVGWEIAPKAWGNGFATEAGHAVAHYAFDAGLDEIFAVVRPQNVKGAATARRVGMEWVGVTEKYYDLTLEVYRLRRGDLDIPTLNVSQTPSEEWGRDELPDRRPRLPG